VVIECVGRSTNEGPDTLTDISWSVGGTYNGSLPTYLFVWSQRSGEYVPLGTGALTYGGYDLGPGQTAETRTVLLLRMSEGTFETELDLSVAGREVLTKTIQFVARAEAAEPPRDLLVTKELVGGPAGEEAMPTATYETKITNEGSTAVTQLTLTDRYGEYLALVSADPTPVSEKAAFELASWDLASFGKESLAPGESLVLRTTYGPAQGSDCGYVTSGVVVEAVVGGQRQFYGAHPDPDQWAMVGDCQGENRPGGGDGGAGVGDGQGGGGGGYEVPPEAMPIPPRPPATGLARGDEGPTPAGGYAWWAAALAAGGASLVGAAMVLRRRAR
jgi:hypothetical protein